MGDTGNALLVRDRHHRGARSTGSGPGVGQDGQHVDRQRRAAPHVLRVDPRRRHPGRLGTRRRRPVRPRPHVPPVPSAPRARGSSSPPCSTAEQARLCAALGEDAALLADAGQARRDAGAAVPGRARRRLGGPPGRRRGAGRGRRRDVLPRRCSTTPTPSATSSWRGPGPARWAGSRTPACSSTFSDTPGVVQRGPACAASTPASSCPSSATPTPRSTPWPRSGPSSTPP